jgi:hypothetical protein
MLLYGPEWRFKVNHEKLVRKADILVEIETNTSRTQNINVTV